MNNTENRMSQNRRRTKSRTNSRLIPSAANCGPVPWCVGYKATLLLLCWLSTTLNERSHRGLPAHSRASEPEPLEGSLTAAAPWLQAKRAMPTESDADRINSNWIIILNGARAFNSGGGLRG